MFLNRYVFQHVQFMMKYIDTHELLHVAAMQYTTPSGVRHFALLIWTRLLSLYGMDADVCMHRAGIADHN